MTTRIKKYNHDKLKMGSVILYHPDRHRASNGPGVVRARYEPVKQMKGA